MSRHRVNHRKGFGLLVLLTILLAFPCLTPTAEAQTVVYTQTYTYDTGTNGLGRLSSVTEKDSSGTTTGTTSFSYDVRGRTIQTGKMVGGTTYTIQTTYDSLNRPSDLTYPDNEVVHHTYNAQGLLSRLSSTTFAIDYVSSLHYNALGQVTSKALGNGKTTTYTYSDALNACPRNNNFRLCTINTISTPNLQNLAYLYDDNGNITGITDTVGAATQSFGYDNLNRLTSASSNVTPTYAHTYIYNAIGNMSSGAGQTFTYPSVLAHQPHAPISDGTSTYTYDANGNMLTKTTGATVRTFAWDVENRLSKVTDNTTDIATFAYDYAGARVKKTANGNTTIYIGKLYECVNGSCSKHLFAGGQHIALKPVGSTPTLYYLADHLGSTNVVTQQDGTLYQSLAYYPYGQTRVNSLGTASGVHHKFTGQELDDDSTGLYFYNARYYDSALMKFISPDNFAGGPVNLSQMAIQQTSASLPDSGGDLGDLISPAALPPSFSGFAGDLSNPQTLNRYAYVYNNPVKFVDPNGQMAFFWHYIITFLASWNSGYYTMRESAEIAHAAEHADFEPAARGPESSKAASTAQHGAMVGILESGERESPEQAIQNTLDFLNKSVKNPRNFDALGHGGHSAADFTLSSHRGQPWPPPAESAMGAFFEEVWHYIRDVFPFGSFINAYKNNVLLIEQANLPASDRVPFTYNPNGSGNLGSYQGAYPNPFINPPE